MLVIWKKRHVRVYCVSCCIFGGDHRDFKKKLQEKHVLIQ